MNKLLQKEIKNITDAIVKNYQPEKIILFGSVAKGKERPDSDIDFLIVKNTRQSKLDRMREIYKLVSPLNYQIPFEPIVYTPKEIRERIDLGDFFVKNILEEGKILYEAK